VWSGVVVAALLLDDILVLSLLWFLLSWSALRRREKEQKKPRSFFRLGVSFQKAIAQCTEITCVYSVCLVSTLVS
jgi:hypothetical protein